MKDKLITRCTDAGEYMSSRFLKGLSLAETVGASNLKLPKHSHRLAGFSLILQGGYIESYGKTELECKPSSVKFHPAGEAHSDFYGNKTVRNFIIELEPPWLTRMDANAFVGNNPVLFSSNSISRLMIKLRNEFHSMETEAPIIIQGLVLELIAETSRSGKEILEDNCPRWLGQAKELLDEQFSENLLSLSSHSRSECIPSILHIHSGDITDAASEIMCGNGELNLPVIKSLRQKIHSLMLPSRPVFPVNRTFPESLNK